MTAVATHTKTKPVLRRTAVQALLACVQYESGPSENAGFGSALHDAIAMYTLGCQAHGEETRLADAARIAEEAFFRVPRGIEAARFDEFRDLVDLFARTHLAELGTLQHVEHTLTTETDFAILTGTVDRIDRVDGRDPDDPPGALLIRDWKSQWAVEDHAFQLRFYAALACRVWPSVEMVATEADHFRVAGKGIVRAEYDRAYLLDWWEQIMGALEIRLGQMDGAPTGGAGCTYCAKRLRCAEAIAPHNAVPENEDQAREIFQTMVRFEAGAAETKAALKKWFGEREPVVWDGLEVGFLTPRESSFKVLDVDGVVAQLDEKGLEGKAALKVDTTLVPTYLQSELVQAGVAEYSLGKPEFKTRKSKADAKAK